VTHLAWGFDPGERQLALEVAANVLLVRQPCFQSPCTVRRGPNLLRAHAEWRWPGVIRLTLQASGELIAQSEPGRPFELCTDLVNVDGPPVAARNTVSKAADTPQEHAAAVRAADIAARQRLLILAGHGAA
jgi:hypothetical protein